MTEESMGVPQRREASAEVMANRRKSSVVTLQGWNEAVFRLDSGEERTFIIQGEHGRHLLPGDRGMLTWQGGAFLSFEKPDGETVGAMYYLPPQGDGGQTNASRNG